MTLTEITAPASEPVTTAEIKAHLRVDGADEDILLAAMVKAARRWCEAIQGRAYIDTTWKQTLDEFATEIELPRSPLSSVTNIKYIDTSGVEQTLAPSVYQVDILSEPGRIKLANGQSWPSIRSGDYNPVAITYVAGYGPDATTAPEEIKMAIKQLVGHWFENREAFAAGQVPAEIELTVKSLLGLDRVHFVT